MAPNVVGRTPYRCSTSASSAATALLQAGPDGVERVRPDPVDELVLPVVAAARERRVVRADEDRLDAGRAQLDAERRATARDRHAAGRPSSRRSVSA